MTGRSAVSLLKDERQDARRHRRQAGDSTSWKPTVGGVLLHPAQEGDRYRSGHRREGDQPAADSGRRRHDHYSPARGRREVVDSGVGNPETKVMFSVVEACMDSAPVAPGGREPPNRRALTPSASGQRRQHGRVQAVNVETKKI